VGSCPIGSSNYTLGNFSSVAIYSNKSKDEFLGMSHGTASHRLKKLILFNLLQELGRDGCFVCGEKISDVEALSIEHKKPWLFVDVALFWDLENIAFSHLRCNRPHRMSTVGNRGFSEQMRKVGPKGTAWCNKHESFLPVSMFVKNKYKWDEYQKQCNDCRNSFPGR
jgi:hypothetical protein